MPFHTVPKFCTSPPHPMPLALSICVWESQTRAPGTSAIAITALAVKVSTHNLQVCTSPPPPHPSSSVPLYYAWLLLQEYIRKIHEPSFGAATKARGERALHDMQLHDVCFGFRPAYCACMHCTCDPPDCPSLRVKFSAMHVPRCAWLL